MKRKDDHMVEVSKDGYQKETINIKSVMSGVVAGNLLAGGLIGIGVDALSGGASRSIPESFVIRLRPITSVMSQQYLYKVYVVFRKWNRQWRST